jgi:hypothetical protein
MKYLGRTCLAFSILVFITSHAATALGQVSPRWFDINPSQSNRDGSDPNGASGGRVNHVGASGDLSRVYAATEWGGLYTSFDQGNSWVKINTFSPTFTWDVKVDPSNSQRVYATSAFDGRAVNPQSGISVSNDAGNTWTPVSFTQFNTLTCTGPQRKNEPAGWQISINPTNSRTVFAGTNCGLARSLDGGGTWTFIDPSPLPAGDNAEQIYAVVAHGNQIVDVIGDNGHFRSTNNGGNWTPVPGAGPGPVPGNSGFTSSLTVSPAENYVLFAQNTTNIWESDDGGTTWPTSLALPLLNGGSNVQGRIPFIKTNQLSTSNQFDIWYGDVNLFKTTATTPSTAAPGGAPRAPLNSWSNKQDQGHWDNGDVMFDPRFTAGACPRLFTNDGGIYVNQRVNNPSCQDPSWEQPNVTPHATWIWGFDGRRLSPGTHAITYGLQDDGGFAATNVAEGHNPPSPNWNNYACCDVSDNSEDSGNLLSLEGFFSPGRAFRLNRRNQDGGGGGEISNYPSAGTFSGFDSGKGNARFGNNAFAVNLSDGVYFTNDISASGIGWTSLNAPSAPTTSSGNIKIATFNTRPNVYYHTGNGTPNNQGVIFRSSLVGTTGAPGSNWTQLPLPAGIGSATVYDIDPTNGNRVIIAGINIANNFEIWKTPDFGANWTRLSQLEGLMLDPASSGTPIFKNRSVEEQTEAGLATVWQPSLFQFNPNDPTTIIAGAIDAGVFLSFDDGNNWQAISTPINPTSTNPHIPRPLFAYFSPGRFNASTKAFDVWVGTRGQGVMKVVVEGEPPSPPDLEVRNIDLNSLSVNCPGGGGTCVTTVTFTIANNGPGNAGAFNVLINLDPGQVVNQPVGGLAAGATQTFTISSPANGNCFNPDCTITVRVDSGNVVSETNESNNQLSVTKRG